MGTVSPVVAKLAVDRLKQLQANRDGDRPGVRLGHGRQHPRHVPDRLRPDRHFGTKGVILVLGTAMAFGATMLGSVWHAVWAGIPLGLCVLAFTPPVVDRCDRQGSSRSSSGKSFEDIGNEWGIREEMGRPELRTSELRLDRREQLLLHQGRTTSPKTGDVVQNARWCSTT